MVDFVFEPHQKDNSVTIAGVTYWGDGYILMPDGSILIANKQEGTDPLTVAVTKIDPTGRIVITEYDSGTTWEEFEQLRDNVIEAIANRSAQTAEGFLGVQPDEALIDDEEGEGIVDPNFYTDLDDLRDYV